MHTMITSSVAVLAQVDLFDEALSHSHSQRKQKIHVANVVAEPGALHCKVTRVYYDSNQQDVC